jgi:hydroxymethylglutaryl-CoA synthase
LAASRGILEKSGLKPTDFRYAVFHMPNGKFPFRAGKLLGFQKEQLEQGWVVNLMGNTYSGSSPTGLAACLDVAQPGDRILITSFGSGAGSDSFVIQATDRLPEIQKLAPATRTQLADRRIHLDYGKYVAYRGKIRMNVT